MLYLVRTDPYGTKPPEHVASIPIPALADNPAYARLVGQANALSRGLEERQNPFRQRTGSTLRLW
jgi:hypothetical protein